MKRFSRLQAAILLFTILASLFTPFLQPPAPAHSDWTPQTWNTQAAYSACLLTNVDNISSPNNILLKTNIYTGDGSDGAPDISGPYLIDMVSAGVVQANSAVGYINVGPTAGLGFIAGQEILIIQMTGTGAGTWETAYIAGVEPSVLVLTGPLNNVYCADATSQAQVIKVPHYTNVTINSGGILMCHAWDPVTSTGGVIFFRATGTVTVNSGGLILASGTGFQGGSGGTQGAASGGGGGARGDTTNGYGYDGGVDGGGASGGDGGLGIMHGFWGGAGGSQGYGGAAGQQGTAGGGPDGGSSDQGGANGSTPSLSLMQAGGGGGGGSSGRQGYGGGGGGGGGLNACANMPWGARNGSSGGSGGAPGGGGTGGLSGGIIAIHANSIIANQGSLIEAHGQESSVFAANGGGGGNGGAGGCGENWCVIYVDGNEQDNGAGGGGGGGSGGQGGGGGNGGAGGGGGVIWLAANNINLSSSSTDATGAPGGAGGQGGGGGSGSSGGCGGSGEGWCAGKNGANGSGGATGTVGTVGGNGGAGAVRLDYATLTGSTNPAPGYTTGLYCSSGTIASNVWDTGSAGQPWTYLAWQETVPSGTGITFAVRASNTIFNMGDNTIPWIPVGSTSPVTSGLPSGRYMQWQATLTTSSNFYTPVLHSVTAASSPGPIVTTNAATFVDATGAVMNGTLNSLGQSGQPVNVNFYYGTNPGGPYTWTGWQQMTAPGNFGAGFTNLSPSTTYYFRASAWDGVNDRVYGDEMSFNTTPVSPSVTTNPPSSVTASSAVLNAYLNSTGTAYWVDISFQWGTTQGGPYPNSTAAQSLNSPGPFNFSLLNLGTGTTYYYRAKAAGGANGTNYGAEMSFTTLRILPLVATGGARTITSSSATLNGSLANMGAASTVNVSYQWGTTQGGPYPNSTTPQAMTAAGPFSAGLTGLAPKTTYYFRAKGDGGTSGISYGAENSFTTLVVQPTVETNGATGITGDSAVLNGNLIALGTASKVDVTFCYGLQPGEFTHTAWQTLSAPGSFQANLTGLTSDTLYYFRAVAQGDGYNVDGAELTFRTSRIPPTVTTSGVTNVTSAAARLNGTLTSLGSAASDNVSFQWGTTPGMYSAETTPQIMNDTGDFYSDLSGLTSATTYYYRAKANGGIDGRGYGDEHSFTTGSQPPSATTNNASQLTTNSAMLNGSLDGTGSASNVNVSFQWGTTRGGPYPDTTAPQARSATGGFQAGLSGLTSRTTYYYRAKADGGIYGTGYGAEKSFSTSSFPPYLVTGSASDITANTATLSGNLYFLGSANTVNVYFVYGTTHNGPYTGTTPLQPMTADGPFTAPLSGLNSATTYYYRAMGDAGQYGATHGEEYAFTTSAVPPTVTTGDAGGETASAATLNGNLTALGTATTVNVSFQYGTTEGGPYPYSTAAQAKTATGLFQASISGLDANTTYYCRAKGDGGIYGISYGAEKYFTTSKVPPSVATDNATNIRAATATLNGYLSSLGTAGTVNASFNWGTAPGVYTHSTTPQAMAAEGPFRANIGGLTALTTYYYQAAANGGVHGSALGAECSFTTGAVPPSVFTGAATLIHADSATLNGILEAMGTSSSDNVSFQWGLRPGVYTGQTLPQSRGFTGDFNAGLSGLNDHTTYYYRAVASGGRHGTSFGSEHAFTTSALPPLVATSAATDWTTDTAFLNGNLTDKGTAAAVNTSFIYGTSHDGPYPGTTPPQVKGAPGTFQAAITGLSPFTTYYFKALANGGIYGTGYGAEENFTTNRLPPVMDTDGAVDVMTNAAILDGNLYLMGTATTVNASFEYGTVHGGPYIGTPAQAMAGPDAYQAQLTGLATDTTYYYRAVGNGGDNGTGYGGERTFTTGKHPPIASTAAAGSITAGSAVLNGNLLSVGSSLSVNVSFQYGTRQGGPYTGVTTPQAKAAPGDFQAPISGLSSHTAYYYRAVAEGGIYGTGYGREMSFITANVPPLVVTGDATNITTNAARLNGNLSSLGTSPIATVSFQWGTDPGVYTGETAAHAMAATGSFSAGLSGLTPGGTYYFRAKAVGDGTGYGNRQIFTALSPAPPVQRPPAPAPSHGSSGQTQAVTPQSPIALPNIVVQSASVSPGRVAPGTPAKVTTTVVNKGNSRGTSAIKLYLNGQVEESRSITLDGGKTANLSFEVNREEPAAYDVYVEGVPAGSFVVVRDLGPDIILIISSTLVVAALVLACVYIWRRRQQGY